MAAMIGFTLGMFLVGLFRSRRRERQTREEITTTLNTGMPTIDTALGRKAREIAENQAAKLHSPPPVHGTARWGGEAEVATLLPLQYQHGRNLRLGTLVIDGQETNLALEVRYPGHLLTVAATGQGKSATQIVENLLSYKGSVVVLDPKGELYDLTASRRRQFGKVYRLAPYARNGEPTDRYNPLDEVDDPRELGSKARHLAEMLIVRQCDKGGGEATFFENEAINLLTAIIMYIVEGTAPVERRAFRTLAEVRRICTLPLLAGKDKREAGIREYLEDVLIGMSKSSNAYIRGQGNLFRGYEQKLLGSFVSEINSNLAFFDGHPGFAEVTAASDFLFGDLSRETVTVYLTIPLKSIHISFRYLRAMIGMAFASLEEQRDAGQASVLFVLDEFAALKDMEFMREAVAQMRSSGAWFWFFVQDVAQLRGVYGQWSNVFLSQTDHQIFFGAVSDPETKKQISTNLGVGTFAYRDATLNWSHNVGMSDGQSDSPTQAGGISRGRNIGQSVSISDPVVLAAKPLLTPFEVGTVLGARRPGESHPSTSIMFSKQAGGYPLLVRRRHWKTAASLALQNDAESVVPATG